MAQALKLRYFGAKLDGKSDDWTALSLALAVGREQQQPVLIPAGSICAYSDVLNVEGIELIGEPGAALHALNTDRCAITLRGSRPSVQSLRLTGVKPAGRSRADNSARVLVLDAIDFSVTGMVIETGSSAGILIRRAGKGTIHFNGISGQLADFIHVTDKSHHIEIEFNICDGSLNEPGTGDDGIAVVSYRSQGDVCHDITAKRNRIINIKHGRCMAVVGGSDILYEHNEMIGNNAAAGLYIAREKSYDTFGVSNVVARRNTIINCGNKQIDHAAVMMFTDDVEPNVNVTLERNLIVLDGVRDGFFLYGQRQTGTLDQNLVVKAAKEYRIGTPGVVVTPYVSGPVGAP